jgi:hypothetical protein
LRDKDGVLVIPLNPASADKDGRVGKAGGHGDRKAG